MNKRLESINKLKEAMRNETLGIHKGADGCCYFDADTQSCCAVGLLLDDVPKSGDESLKYINNKETIEDVLYSGYENNTGLTNNELIKLQGLHDAGINATGSVRDLQIKRLNDYIKELSE